jgi:hypothetical protein
MVSKAGHGGEKTYKRWNPPRIVMTDLIPDLSYDQFMTNLGSLIKWNSPTFRL